MVVFYLLKYVVFYLLKDVVVFYLFERCGRVLFVERCSRVLFGIRDRDRSVVGKTLIRASIKVVCSVPARGEVYPIQLHVIKHISVL